MSICSLAKLHNQEEKKKPPEQDQLQRINTHHQIAINHIQNQVEKRPSPYSTIAFPNNDGWFQHAEEHKLKCGKIKKKWKIQSATELCLGNKCAFRKMSRNEI